MGPLRSLSHNLSDIIAAVLRTYPDSTVAKSWKRQLIEEGGLSEQQVLELIKVALEDDQEWIRFDWLGMHGRCQKFIKAMWDGYASKLEQLSEDLTNPVEGLQTPPDFGRSSASDILEIFEDMISGDYMTSLTVPMYLLATDPAVPERALRNVLADKFYPVLFILRTTLGISMPAAAEVLGPIIDGEGRDSERSLDA
jgi:hypothetical protein